MTLLDLIRPEFPEVVAVTGGGGKSTVIVQLAREAAALGARVLITAVERPLDAAWPELGPVSVESADLSGLPVVVLASGRDGSGRLTGVTGDEVPGGFDLVLAETGPIGGSSLAMPETDVPYPRDTSLVLAVAGLDAMEERIAAMHQGAAMAALAGVAVDAPVTAELVAAVLSHPLGSTRGRPEQARVLYVLNKTDDELRLQQAKQIAALLPGPAVATVEGFAVWPQAAGQSLA